MTRVRSTHGAPCCGVAPGAEGEVDEANLGVRAALAGGLLVRVEAPSAPAGPDPRDARIAELEAKVAELTAIIEAPAAPLAPAESTDPTPTGRAKRQG